MTEETVRIPLAVAVIVLSVLAVLLVSLAITAVFFDKAGYLRRFKARPRALSRVSANGSARRTGPTRRPTKRAEPWGPRDSR